MKGIISFYEKPGCKNNNRQKELLSEAGYKLQVIDLLNKEWNREDLLKFFQYKSIFDCINLKAPVISNKKLIISDLSEDELLEEMIKSPILIKRPLIFYRGQFGIGFDSELVKTLLGQKAPEMICHKNVQCPTK